MCNGDFNVETSDNARGCLDAGGKKKKIEVDKLAKSFLHLV